MFNKNNPLPPVGNRTGYLWALAAASFVTLLAAPLSGRIDLANIVMLYMVAVVAIAIRFGKGPAVLVTIANVLAVDFFFVPPHFSLAVADAQYLVTFAVMLATGLVIAELAARLRREAAAAAKREQRSNQLYALARQLSGALAESQIADAAGEFFSSCFNAPVWLLLRDREGRLSVPDLGTIAPKFDRAIAESIFAAEGHNTDSSAPSRLRNGLLYVPLRAPMRVRGVMLLSVPADAPLHDAEERQQIETVAVLIAIALERVHFVTVAREVTVNMESERLRNTLLAALSHDLRTPLTAILGSAEALQRDAQNLPTGNVALIDSIHEQANRTNALVENILDMARLESGNVHLNHDWQSLEEIVGSAIKSRAPVLTAHTLATALPDNLPLVDCDANLIERVLVNLLENAAKYSPIGSTIKVSASVQSASLRIDVDDSGPGVPPGQEALIFGKFVRVGPTASVPGLGLGLAICRTIVEAHGGKIWVEHSSLGGACFSFTLPLGTPPTLTLEADESK